MAGGSLKAAPTACARMTVAVTTVALTAVVLTAVVLMPVASAHGAVTRVGRLPTPPLGARFHGPVPGATRLHVSVTLRPRNAGALAAYARAVSMPGSPDYRRYLTPGQFARRFGATATQVKAVRRSLRAEGLTPGPVSRGALSIPVVATAAQLERAFSITLDKLSLPGRRMGIAAPERPAIQTRVASAIQSIVGLSTVSAPHPLLVRGARTTSRGALDRAHAGSGGPHACAAAAAAAPGQSAYTADQIASAYGFPGLYAAGDLGSGVTVAVYELESDDASDIAAYQSCYGTHATVSTVPVDGGAGGGPGSGEAALDIENLIGLAPRADVLVYQGPNSNSGSPGSGPYDTLSAIVNDDRAHVVTVSWGQCEAALGENDAQAENLLLQQATVQGQSIVAASGDSGAEDCDTGGALPQTQAAVDDPSSQPFVTGVGGTSLKALGPRPTETVWNSGGTLLSGTVQPGAGGGGVSSLWAMPPAQLDSEPGLGVRGPAAAGSTCENPSGLCREVPDVAADGDPSSGYLIYWNGKNTVSGAPAGWQGIGGTSGAAPLWAALLTLADGSGACSTSPVGYANPALYRAAAQGYAADFNDVTTGNNDFTGTNGGRFAATLGYDPVTGLGTPNASALATALCAATARLPSPRAQRSTVRVQASVRVRGSDTGGATLTYAAAGLPPGLHVNASSGQISGRPSHVGRYTVHVTVRDTEGSTATTSFIWTVGDPPRVSRLSLVRTALGPSLVFTVTAGRNAPALESLTLTLPRTLRVVAARAGIAVTSTARKPVALRFTDRATRATTLTITLRRSASSLRVKLGPPSLSAAGGRVAALRGGTKQALALMLTDVNAERLKVTAKVAVARG
jgi:hypothetical protein